MGKTVNYAVGDHLRLPEEDGMKMKISSILIALAFVIGGCASVSFDPESGKIEYSRMGDQHIQGFEASKTKDGFKVKFQGQQSNADALTEAIKVIGTLTK